MPPPPPLPAAAEALSWHTQPRTSFDLPGGSDSCGSLALLTTRNFHQRPLFCSAGRSVPAGKPSIDW